MVGEKVVLRYRMSAGDAHYAGQLVEGAHIVTAWGDVGTELAIRLFGDESLFVGYSEVRYTAPVYSGDWMEYSGWIEKVGNTSFTCHFEAHKVMELADQGMDFETIKEKVMEYYHNTHILFCLESMMNLARNGRTSMAVAKIAGMLGIRVCGDVKGGMITPVHKPRGAKKTTQTLVEMMKERGFYDGAQLRIAHCFGQTQAQDLADAILAEFPNARITIEPTTALCSFYAEAGGLMIGFEGGYNAENDPEKF